MKYENKSRIYRFLLHTLYFILLSGCGKLMPPDIGTGSGRGIVRRVDYDHHMITLEHGTIKNLLNPMTYSYPVKSDTIMRPIHEGDTVTVTIEENPPGEFRVLALKQVHPPPLAPR